MSKPISSTLRAALDEIIVAAGHLGRLHRIGSALRNVTNCFHSLGTLAHEDDDEVLLHASDALTIDHITLTPGLQYPPHNHLMDALIGIYFGGETNFTYPLADDQIVWCPERRDVLAPAVIHMPPHVVHSVANTGAARSGAIHVYLGNLPTTQRQMWRFSGGMGKAFNNDRYLADARAISGATL